MKYNCEVKTWKIVDSATISKLLVQIVNTLLIETCNVQKCVFWGSFLEIMSSANIHKKTRYENINKLTKWSPEVEIKTQRGVGLSG